MTIKFTKCSFFDHHYDRSKVDADTHFSHNNLLTSLNEQQRPDFAPQSPSQGATPKAPAVLQSSTKGSTS